MFTRRDFDELVSILGRDSVEHVTLHADGSATSHFVETINYAPRPALPAPMKLGRGMVDCSPPADGGLLVHPFSLPFARA